MMRTIVQRNRLRWIVNRTFRSMIKQFVIDLVELGGVSDLITYDVCDLVNQYVDKHVSIVIITVDVPHTYVNILLVDSV